MKSITHPVTKLSRHFDKMDVSEMGLKRLEIVDGAGTFDNGQTSANFQTIGMYPSHRLLLKITHRVVHL